MGLSLAGASLQRLAFEAATRPSPIEACASRVPWGPALRRVDRPVVSKAPRFHLLWANDPAFDVERHRAMATWLAVADCRGVSEASMWRPGRWAVRCRSGAVYCIDWWRGEELRASTRIATESAGREAPIPLSEASLECQRRLTGVAGP